LRLRELDPIGELLSASTRRKSCARRRCKKTVVLVMPTFTPMSTAQGLPAVATSAEAAVFDLKARFPTQKQFEAAKDVAAFANHIGGPLLIGAEEEAGRIARYVPLTETEANTTDTFIATAVRDRCSPLPLIDIVRFTEGAGFVLAVNVWPSLASPIAVRVVADRGRENWGGSAHVFPIRVGSHTDFIPPENLAMYMTPHIRRAVLMLNKIPSDAAVDIRMPTVGGGVSTSLTVSTLWTRKTTWFDSDTEPTPPSKNTIRLIACARYSRTAAAGMYCSGGSPTSSSVDYVAEASAAGWRALQRAPRARRRS
jgi:hypothetical protein